MRDTHTEIEPLSNIIRHWLISKLSWKTEGGGGGGGERPDWQRQREFPVLEGGRVRASQSFDCECTKKRLR